MKSAFTDFKALGSMSVLLPIMNTWTLNEQHLELASLIAVNVIAVFGIKESEKGAYAPLFMRLIPLRYLYAIAYGVLGIAI